MDAPGNERNIKWNVEILPKYDSYPKSSKYIDIENKLYNIVL